MDIVVAVVLGIVQGLTEWLPVSSSGHLVIAQEVYGVDNPVLFDAVLHLGTMVSVIVFLRRRMAEVLRAFLDAMTGKTTFADSRDAALGIYIIIATIPILLLGLLLERHINTAFESLPTVAMALVITGGVILFTAHLRATGTDLTHRRALTIGLAQSCALFPGISRSGMTISAGLYSGLSREDAAEFAFLLSLPAILAAGAYQLYKAMTGDAVVDPGAAAAGFTTALVVGYLTLKVLFRMVVTDRFHYFAYYCFGLATVLWTCLLLL